MRSKSACLCSLRVCAVFVVLDLVYRLRHARAQTDSSLAFLCLKTLGHPAVNRSTIHSITLQFQCCCKFSRCASVAASPTIGDVKPLNKLARQIKSQPVKLQFWPLTGPLRIVGFLDASYRNNEGGSSQRGMPVFFGRIALAIVKRRNVAWKSN